VRKLLTEIANAAMDAPLPWSRSARTYVTRVLPRGNWQDETGEIVQPVAPHFLPQIPDPDGHRLTRLDLAKWLVSPGTR